MCAQRSSRSDFLFYNRSFKLNTFTVGIFQVLCENSGELAGG